MAKNTKMASARILVRPKAGDILEKISVHAAFITNGTIKRRKVPLKDKTRFFQLTMPIGHHAIPVKAPGYYEAVRRVRFERGLDDVVHIILESRHRPRFPRFDALPDSIKSILGDSKTYTTLPQRKKAAALNILAKMKATPIVGGTKPKSVLSYVEHIYEFFPDRIFVRLKHSADLLERIEALTNSGGPTFVEAPTSPPLQ